MSGVSEFLKSVAPTVASVLAGPLAGIAVAGLGKAFGIDNPTLDTITKTIQGGKITPEGMLELQKLDAEFREHEAGRGFKYADLELKDRDSARQANVQGGTQTKLFWLSLFLLSASIGTEIYILLNGLPREVPDIIAGRIVGLLESITMLVLGYWYGSSSGSHQKTELMSQGK